MSHTNQTKYKGLRRSSLMKFLMVLLFILSIPAAIAGVYFTVEFAEADFYTNTPEKIHEEQMERICLWEIIELNDKFHSMNCNPTDLEELYASYESNFEFALKDKDGEILAENLTGSAYRYERTKEFFQTVSHTKTVHLTQEEYDAYIFPPNAELSVEEVWELPKNPTQETGGDATGSEEMVCSYNVTIRTYEQVPTHSITGYVREELTADDDFARLNKYLTLAYNYRYVPMIVFAVSLLVLVLSLSYLLYAAGYRRSEEQPTESVFDKIPFDIFTVILGIAGLFTIVLIDEFTGFSEKILEMAIICSLLTLCGLLLLWWLVSLTIRIRTGRIIRNNLISYIASGIGHMAKTALKTPILLQVIAIAAGGFFLQFIAFVMLWDSNEFGVFLLILLNIAVMALLCLVTINLHQLEQGSKKIAEGDFSYKIPTSQLFGAFRQHGERLNSISDGMNHAVSERMKSEMFKTELIANVSHDIRTPLTSIINYTDLLSKLDLQDAQAREYIEVITRQSERLRKLTEDVLEASKATTGNLKAELEQMDLRVLLEQLQGEYEERFEARSLTVVCNLSDDVLPIMADGRHLWRVMDNLFGNVCKYAMHGTRVYLDAGIHGDCVELTLRNISAVQLHISAEALMERFVQGDRSRNTEGSGLGLSIAQSLTELQGGNLELQIDGDLFKVKLTFPKAGM